MNKLSYLLFCMAVLMGNGSLLAQSAQVAPPRLPGELIIQVAPEVVAERLGRKSLFGQHLRYERCLSARMGLYLFRFPEHQLNAQAVMLEVNRWPEVIVAQYNHLIESRGQLATLPNDPDFLQQWGLDNTGQQGGVADADIDAPEAWDLTTGGATSRGDSIVIAVLDQGFDLTHPDLWFWKNEAEIPGNGIDDDQNGYVDDYDGWNAVQHNGMINSANHGTHVTGIAAARGDNMSGVAGVNWHTKVLPVVTLNPSLTEANVVEAYGYVLEMRRLYAETQGAKGAYIVVANSSFGINNAQPADFPIWCAMYDSLGSAGILSVVSTMNNGLNVDVVGDMPSTCPSDWVIAVTASERTDIRNGSSGFGPVNIDLAAPGRDVYSTYNGGTYGLLTGTSMAAPHVTGAVALLYTYACPALIDLYEENPGPASLLFREQILGGVDVLPTLQGDIATEGRLNAYNSLLLIDSLCGTLDTNCLPISQLQAFQRTDTSAILHWAGHAATSFEVRIRALGTSSWTTFQASDTFLQVVGLNGCTEYEFQVAPTCGNYLFSETFQTQDCCEAPTTLLGELLSDSSLQVNWPSVFGVDIYRLEFKKREANVWQQEMVADTQFVFTGLPSCSAWEFRVGSDCDTIFNGFTETLSLTTGNCDCTGAGYCSVANGDASSEWIDSVKIGSLVNASGNNQSYAFFNNLCWELERDSTYALRLVPGFVSFQFAEAWRLWIDFNQDGDFEDEGELLFAPNDGSDTVVLGQISIPATALTGNTRMRIGMQFEGFSGFNPPEQCTRADFGEFEDYCVTITEGELTCPLPCPVNLTLGQNDSASQIRATWTGGAVSGYALRYRAYGSVAPWALVASTQSSYQLTGLDSCTTYEVQVQSFCNNDSSGYGPSDTLTTTGCMTSSLALELAVQVKVFPNPFSQQLAVQAPKPIEKLILRDLQGRSLMEREVALRRNVELSVPSLAPGLYLLEIETTAGRIHKRVWKN